MRFCIPNHYDVIMYLTKSSSIGTPNPQPTGIGWGFFWWAMSPYYLLRLFSQNVKPAIMHPETTGAIILTKSSSTGLTSFRRIYRRKLRRLCYYIICELLSICTSDKLNYVKIKLIPHYRP